MDDTTTPNHSAPAAGSTETAGAPIDDRDPCVPRRFKIDPKGGGRPRGSKNHKTIMREVANERHTIQMAGTRRRMTTLELVILTLRQLALDEGKPRALDLFFELQSKYRPEPIKSGGYIVAPAPMSPEDWIREQMELNKTRMPPEDYKGD